MATERAGWLVSTLPRRRKAVLLVVATAVVLAVPVWLTVPWGGARPATSAELEPAGGSALYLGFDYLPITARVSRYYGLGVESGALVTRVVSGSPADRAGLKVGDAIVAFNEAPLDGQTSLLEMLMACPGSQEIMFQVCDGAGTSTVRLLSTGPR